MTGFKSYSSWEQADEVGREVFGTQWATGRDLDLAREVDSEVRSAPSQAFRRRSEAQKARRKPAPSRPGPPEALQRVAEALRAGVEVYLVGTARTGQNGPQEAQNGQKQA